MNEIPYKLDKKDRKILFELEVNCRQSNSEIGKKVGLSKQVVDYRIKKLMKDGIITRFSTVINTYKLGYLKFKVFLKLQDADKEKINEIIQFFRWHKNSEWLGECSGRWDLIVGYIVRDIYEFNEAWMEALNKFSQYIAEKETNVSLGAPHYRKEYLLHRDIAKMEPVMQMGKPIDYKTDEIDIEILRILSNNARMSIVDIAKRAKTTARVVKYRIKEMKKKEILLMHRCFLDLNKLGYIYCKANFYLRNLKKEKLESFLNYCAAHPNITYTILTIGPWEMEIEFEIENFNRFHEEMQKIRDKFADIIKDYDYVIVIKEHKLDYYPECYPRLS